MANKVLPDDDQHDELYRLMGKFIGTWSQVDWIAVTMFAELMRTDIERARIVLAAQISTRGKREMIDRMGQSFLPDLYLPEFNKIIERLKWLAEKRHILAHRRLYYRGKGKFRFFNDQDATLPNTFGRYEEVQLGHIRQWIKDAEVLNEQILLLTAQLMGAKLLPRARLVPVPSDGREIGSDPHRDSA